MFRLISIVVLFSNIIFSQVRLAELSGTVFLSDQTNDHSGVKIKFESVSSSGTTDSTISNSDGTFSIGLNDGIYVVSYSKSGYIPYTLPGSFSYAGGSYELDDVTLNAGSIIELSGRIRGTLYNDYQYRVTGDIEIERGDTLIIEPGTSVLFMGSYGIDVYGSLIAVGTEEDSIYFNSGAAQPSRGDWEKIHIKSSQNCDDAISRVISFQYCNINNGGGNGYYGVIFDESTFSERDHINCQAQLPIVNVLNSRVTNSADKLIVSSNSRIHVENTLLSGYNEYPLVLENTNAGIISNEIIWNGGGDWSPLFYISLQNDGSNKSRKIEIKNNFFKTNNSIGRVYSLRNNGSQKDSVIISGNSFLSFDQMYDFFIQTRYEHYTLIEENTFEVDDENSRSSQIFSFEQNDESIFRNNTIKRFYTAFRHNPNAKTLIENNILVDGNYVFSPNGSASSSIIQNNIFYDYNYFFNNDAGQTYFSVGLGDVLTVNSNGDSIDTYSNLFINPKFVPSDSTIIYGWTLNQNGNLEFVANPYTDYYVSHIGNPNGGSVQFYSNENGWSQQFQFQPQFIPLEQSSEFQRLNPNVNFSQSNVNSENEQNIEVTDYSDIKKKDRIEAASIRSIQLWGVEEYNSITSEDKVNGLAVGENSNDEIQYNRNDRNQDIIISLTVDGYATEASWNVWDYTSGSYYYTSNQLFSSNYETIEETISLANGSYSVDVWDSYGDGGVSGSVTNAGGDVLVSWLDSDYTNFGEFLFSVGDPEAFGCTDPDALNFDEDADTDDGSCQYPGDACVNALQAIIGTNYADGDNEYFVYTATVNGGLIISSVSETNDEDTRLYVAASCENAQNQNWIAENDDYNYSQGVYSSYVEIPITAGQDYIIYWSDNYGPGPFSWTLTEGVYSELWSTNIDFYELYPNGGYPDQIDLLFYGDQGARSKYFYGINIIGNPELFKYQAYSNYISENSPAVDAGNPDPLLYDPDGTISDIGANYYHQGDQGSISAPIADFSSSSVEGSYPLYVEFTSISSGAVTGYTWNFGDGSTSNSRRPVHLYTSAGTYSVSLTVTGPGGEDTMIKTDFITVSSPSLPPIVSFSAEPTAGVLPLEVVFSSSIVNDAESVLWNFGDGSTSSELNPTHTYDAIGLYTVSFTATNSYGTDVETKENYINVIGPEEVIAGFDAAPRIGIAPMEVSFINESVGTIESVLWNFGNGSSSDQLSPIYTYDQPGKYDVRMIAYGTLNNDTIQEFDFIDVYDKRPIISSIVDIPNDQGGQVLLRWNPSGWDGPVGSKIAQYSLWEDYNGEWININNAMANQSDSYAFLANTFADSNSESVNWSRFKVLAHTNEPGVFYESPVDSGFSIDNVPPSTPSAVLATISSNGIDLEWGEVNESNFMYYNLYRNGEKIAELTDQVYTDFNLGSQTPSYYQVTAVDDGGNESEPTPETVVDATDLAWFINIRGSMIGGESDLFNFIGTSEDATADFDEGYDIFEPPTPPANYLAISFPVEGLETILGDELAQDIHKDIVLTDTMHVWHMNAISNVSDSAIFYFDMANVPDVPIIVEHIASGQRAYLSDSSWFGFGMIADSLYQFKISLGDTTSPVLAMHQNVNGPRILHSDSSYVFSWDITDGNGLDSVFAYASTDSGYSYNLISSWSGQIDTLIYTIPDTTIATGCMIQIHGRDYAGNHITKQSDQVFTIVGDSLSVFVGSGWNLWGAPMVPYVGNMADNLEEEINGYWYTYGFEEGGYTFDSTLSIGHGYWLATLDDANVGIHGMPLSEEYNQDLNLGWNIISNPLVLDVSVDSLTFDKDSEVLGFSDALDAGWINSIYSYDNQGYEMPSILKPWTGYWISVLDSGISVTYPIHKGVESNQPVMMVRDESSWNISFEAAIDGAIDRLTVMGVAEDATNGFDPAYDIAEAPNPPGGEYVTMSTYHQDWPSVLGERYSKDVKSPIVNGGYNEWTFNIESSSDEVEITWLFENVPDEYQIGYNYTDGMFFADMRAIESLVIPNGSELIVRVGAELLASESSDLLPQVYSLHQNYPNPFNPVTSIYFDVPKAGNVNISIYDMLGRKIKTLVNENLNPGFLNIQWNATNELSQPVSAGVYIYTIEADNFRQTRKMILLK